MKNVISTEKYKFIKSKIGFPWNSIITINFYFVTYIYNMSYLHYSVQSILIILQRNFINFVSWII